MAARPSIGSMVVFPVSGYLAMATEALFQCCRCVAPVDCGKQRERAGVSLPHCHFRQDAGAGGEGGDATHADAVAAPRHYKRVVPLHSGPRAGATNNVTASSALGKQYQRVSVTCSI